MIFIHNLITLCRYFINNTIWFVGIDSIEFEYIDEDTDEREICYCNLCNTFRNIILFATRRLKCNKIN
jgi:hypothetical protein